MGKRARNVTQVTITAFVALLILVAGGYLAVGGASRFHNPLPELRFDGASPSFEAPLTVLEADRGDEPVPSTSGITAAVGNLLAPEELGSVAASVADLSTGESLFSYNDSAKIPASTTKIVTAVAVLHARGAEYRIPTRVIRGMSPGEVVLVGMGDPTLSRDGHGSYPGAARLDALAQQVRESMGDESITQVTIDDSLFGSPSSGPGWPSGALQSTYVAPIVPLMLDGGRSNPQTSERVSDPAMAAGSAFAQLLGVGNVVRGSAPSAEELGIVYSASIHRLVEVMLAVSDNVLAEALARQVALARGVPATFAGAAQAISEELAEENLALDGVADGSGLSRNNRLTASELTSVLHHAATDSAVRAALAGLPVAAYEGTVENRFDTPGATAGAGLVRAKTGTLNHVNTLAGIVTTADGRQLAFAVLANDFPSGGNVTAALDGFVAELAECGCT